MRNKAIIVRPDYSWSKQSLGDGNPEFLPVLRVLVCGALTNGKHVTLQILEVDQRESANQHTQPGGETIVGTIHGKLSATRNFRQTHTYEIHPDTTSTETRGPHACAGFLLREKQARPTVFQLPLRKATHRSSGDGQDYWFDGDYWEIKLRIPELNLESPIFPIAWQPRVVPALFTEDNERQATYDWHAGNDFEFFTDASRDADGTSGAFHEIARAIRKAQSFIFIVDWSFHPTIFLDPKNRTLRNTLGALLLHKANAGVLVAIHTWYHDELVAEHPNEDAYQIMLGMANRLQMKRPKNLLWRGSRRFPTGWIKSKCPVFWSHHQKFIVLDGPAADGRREIRTFFGGLDLTKGRFDWDRHPLFADDAACARFRHPVEQDGKPWQFKMNNQRHHYDDWYNGEFPDPTLAMLADENVASLHPREPWHDVHASVTGPVAWDFLREFVGRWVCRKAIEHEYGPPAAVWKKFQQIMKRDHFVPQWETGSKAGPWTAQLLHSIVRGHIDETQANPAWHPQREEFDWNIGREDYEKSIQQSYLSAIDRAERFIYIENQYFTGSGSKWQGYFSKVENKIPESLVNRILEKHRAGREFHVYVVMPMIPEGNTIPKASDKSGKVAIRMMSNHAIRSLEWQTMAWMINALKEKGLRWEEYLSFYWLAGGEGVSERLTASWVTAMKRRSPETLQDQLDLRKELANLNRRAMIYVHSKLMIVDDRFVILGSANINERSMAGDRDTEICVALWPSTNRVEEECEQKIREQLRYPLWSEHLGGLPDGAEKPESLPTRHAFQVTAQQNFWELWFGRAPKGNIAMMPFETDGEAWTLPGWLDLRLRNSQESPLTRSEDPRYILDALWQYDADYQVAWSWECFTSRYYGYRPLSYLVE